MPLYKLMWQEFKARTEHWDWGAMGCVAVVVLGVLVFSCLLLHKQFTYVCPDASTYPDTVIEKWGTTCKVFVGDELVGYIEESQSGVLVNPWGYGVDKIYRTQESGLAYLLEEYQKHLDNRSR